MSASLNPSLKSHFKVGSLCKVLNEYLFKGNNPPKTVSVHRVNEIEINTSDLKLIFPTERTRTRTRNLYFPRIVV